MRTFLWLAAIMVILAGCTDDSGSSADQDDDTSDPGDDGTGSATGDNGTGDMDEDDAEDAFAPTYINGTLSQNLVDCSDPSDMAASGSSHDLPDGAGGRSYSVTITSAGDVPTEAICVGFDSGSASGTSGTVPDDATSITIGGDFAVGTGYSIFIE